MHFKKLLRTRKPDVGCATRYLIGKWPNRLRYLLWEQVSESSSLFFPTILEMRSLEVRSLPAKQMVHVCV